MTTRAQIASALAEVGIDGPKLEDAVNTVAALVGVEPTVVNINEAGQLVLFAEKYGLRGDWHEPDEQGITARVVGDHLDNAMGSGLEHSHGELQVVLVQTAEYSAESDEPRDIAVINLATLLSWATKYGATS